MAAEHELPSPLEALRDLIYAFDRRAPEAHPWPTQRERFARDMGREVLKAHDLPLHWKGEETPDA